MAAFYVFPVGEAALVELTLGSLHLRKQRAPLGFFAPFNECFEAGVHMNQLRAGPAQIAVVFASQFRQNAVGVFVEFDLPTYHAVRISCAGVRLFRGGGRM